jgi:molecular chaperone GrpE
MTTQNDINDAIADALESVEKKEAQEQAVPQTPNEAKVEPSPTEYEATLEAEAPAADPETTAREEAEPEAETSEPGAVELKDQLMRLAADFENFKKRTRREKEDIRKFANEQLLKDVLPPLDNLNRALAHVEDRENPLVQGIEMVAKQFLGILDGYGVTTVNSKGKPFDPAVHDAMGQTPSAEYEPGCIVDEFEKGYLLHGRLLRPAKVIVATAPVASQEPTEENSDSSQETSPES